MHMEPQNRCQMDGQGVPLGNFLGFNHQLLATRVDHGPTHLLTPSLHLCRCWARLQTSCQMESAGFSVSGWFWYTKIWCSVWGQNLQSVGVERHISKNRKIVKSIIAFWGEKQQCEHRHHPARILNRSAAGRRIITPIDFGFSQLRNLLHISWCRISFINNSSS